MSRVRDYPWRGNRISLVMHLEISCFIIYSIAYGWNCFCFRIFFSFLLLYPADKKMLKMKKKHNYFDF